MADPNLPTDQVSTLTVSELRRRMMASTPPTSSTTSTPPEPLTELVPEPATLPATAIPGANWSPGPGAQDLLARLRMPGRTGPVQAPPITPPPTPAIPMVPGLVQRRAAQPPPITPPPPPVSRNYVDSNNAIAGALNQLADLSQGSSRYDDSSKGDIQRLKSENKELRTLLDEMKHLLQEASDTEQRLVAKEKEFEAMVAEKDAHLNELSTQLGAIEEQIAKGELAPPPPIPKTRTELEEWSDDLEKENAKLTQERKKLDQERLQLREDEEACEQQMRQMEVQMARERAMIARQETELKRLSAEIQHDLDILQRGDAGHREMLAKFQRRAQDVMNKPGGTPPPRR